MKSNLLFRSKTFLAIIILILVSQDAMAGDMKLAGKLRIKIQQIQSFTAEYLAQSDNNKEDIKIRIAYRHPDLVYIEIPTQKIITIYDGQSLLLMDIPSNSAVLMKMDSLKELLGNASRPFESLGDWIDAKKLREYQKLYAYPVVGLTKSGLDVAVGFSPKSADASWLRRMELDQASVQSGPSEIKIRHGEYLLTLDAGNGRLLSMSDESSSSKRILKLVEWNEATPRDILFNTTIIGSKADSAVKNPEPGESLINTVVQRQFQMILHDLLEKEAPKWVSMGAVEKKRIRDAIREYWRIVFQSNTQLKTKLSALALSKESRELIKMQLKDKSAIAAFKNKNVKLGETALKSAWAKSVGMAFTRQILHEALAPIQRGIVLDAKTYTRQLGQRIGMDKKEAAQMLQMHIDPMENALIEILGMTIFEKIMIVVEELKATSH